MQTSYVRIVVVAVFIVLLGGIIYMKSRKAARPDREVSPKAAQVKGNAPTPSAQVESPKAALPILLDFGRGQCVMCKQVKPVLEELKKELAGKVEVRIVDTGENPEEADKFHIEMIPTQVFLDAKGKEVYRNVGFMPKKDILAKLKEMGVK
jgi:thioredoxin 1